ncbi:MAG: conjugative relaxase [Rhodospirillales bacterium]|nr:conjugative relaxase [Rhodospirillales bacterium]
MLSIYAITTPEGMSTYYDSDGYYAKDDEQAQKASQWHGKGAKATGLEGFVTPETFQYILDGNTPDGRRLGRMVDGEWKHRAGIDLTFSAPKSVSVMALVAGDERLVAAHEAAVKATLDHIEAKVLETRVWDRASKTQVKERGLDMIAALFRHEVNRNQDPHLHTHSVIANIVRQSPENGGDGKWRSIEGASLFHHKMELGAMYRAELAMNVRELGYEIERTHMDGRFDLKGVPKSVLATFSTRSKEIRDVLQGYDYQNAKTAAVATLMTRNHKTTVDRDALHKDWHRQGEKLGLTARIPTEPVLADSAQESRLAAEAVDYAIRHLSERSSTFNLSDLRTKANGYGVGQFRPRTLDQAVTSNHQLIPSKHKDHEGQEFVTTRDAIAKENETITSMKAAQNTVQPFMEFSEINDGLKDTFLNEGQQRAVRGLLTGQDRIMGIQGYAGVGKTTLLTAARELAQKRDYEVIGLAPSASAVKTMQDETGIASRTLQKFLGQYDGYAHGRGSEEGKVAVQDEFKNKLIVLDESSLASTTQMRDLFRIVEAIRPARLVLLGDEKQLDAVDAGKPFAQLQKNGMKTLNVDEIVRQKNPELKTAVHAAIAGDIRTAFAKISNNIIEAEEPQKDDNGKMEPGARDDALAAAAFTAWNALPIEARETTGIAAPTHVLRQSINGLVREQLALEGQLSGPEKQIDVLKSEGYTNAQKGRAKNYFPGDQVIFNRARNGVEQGEVLAMAGANEDTNTVALKRENGEIVSLNLNQNRAAQAVDILRASPLDIRQGDRIRFTRNDESLGLINSGIADVTNIDKQGRVTLEKEDGSSLTLDGDSQALRFIDHAWASTVHAFQGRTVDNIIGVMHSSHPHLTHQKAFYVEISRARENAMLITDDRQTLGRTLTEVTGERIAALEATPEYKSLVTSPELNPEPVPEVSNNLDKDIDVEIDR